MKKLKSLTIDGAKIVATRFRGVDGHKTSNKTAYDEFEDDTDEKLDQFSLRKILKDYMHTDPAMRYQLGGWRLLYIVSFDFLILFS